MNERGLTLLELLLACLIVLAVTGAVAALAVPVRHAFDRTIGAADLTAGSRSALDRMSAELREAGSGAHVGLHRTRLGDVAAVVEPLADLASGSIAAPGRAVRLTRIAAAAAEGVLAQPAAGGTTTLQLDPTGRCTAVGPACGLEPGMTGMVYDARRASSFVVSAVGAGGSVQLMAGLASAFEPGAVVAATSVSSYGLRQNADGSQRLVRLSPGGAEQPVLQNVVDFEIRVEGHAVPPQPGSGDNPWPTYGPAPPAVGLDDGRDAWGAGENCTIARDAAGGAMPRLAALGPVAEAVTLTTALLTDGPWCADASDAARFDADLLRVAAVEIVLRVEAASAVLRGPAGQLFRRAGTEVNAARWVPDVELRLAVKVRNAGR